MKSVKRYLRVNREDICYLSFILQAYSGLAVVRTVDSRRALIEVTVAPQCTGLFEEIIRDLVSREGLKITMEKIANEYDW